MTDLLAATQSTSLGRIINLFDIEFPNTAKDPNEQREYHIHNDIGYPTLTLNDVVYDQKGVELGDTETNSSDELPRLSLSVANFGFVYGLMNVFSGLERTKIVFRKIIADNVADDGVITGIEFSPQKYYVSRIESMSFQVATFELITPFELYNTKLPRRRMSKICQYDFGDANCGYAVGASPELMTNYFTEYPTCPKTLDACRKRQRESNWAKVTFVPNYQTRPLPFGGFPTAR